MTCSKEITENDVENELEVRLGARQPVKRLLYSSTRLIMRAQTRRARKKRSPWWLLLTSSFLSLLSGTTKGWIGDSYLELNLEQRDSRTQETLFTSSDLEVRLLLSSSFFSGSFLIWCIVHQPSY